jgi:hypothetical protein
MVIESVTDIQRIKNKLENEVAYAVPIFADQHLHSVYNQLSSLHILFDDNEYVCIPINHPDGSKIDIDISNAYKIVTLYKKEILHAYPSINQYNVYDIASHLHLKSDKVPEVREYYTPYIQRSLQQFQFRNLHLTVPLVVWMEYAHNLLGYIRDKYKTDTPSGFDFVNNTIIPTLTTIEQSGLYVDVDLLKKYFQNSLRYVNNNLIYTGYNPYTSTGRPSNKFGGVNFAALNKTTGIREVFTSRYGDDGLLIQLDYEAFHLRLVANQLKYTLPETSVHKYLAEQYYNTPNITDEQYEASKARTFAIMYGMNEDVGNVEFFKKVRKYTEELWEVYRDTGYVVSKMGRKIIIEDPSPNKVFNYMVQCMETEEALTRVSSVCELLENKLTKPILYTYDALLLDLHRSETALLPRIKYLMETDVYPTRMYKGKNYNELILV